jgi:hypothetical protein
MFDAYDLIALCGQAEHLRAELRLLRAERDGLLVCLATAPIPRKENGCAWQSLDNGKGALSDTEKGAGLAAPAPGLSWHLVKLLC